MTDHLLFSDDAEQGVIGALLIDPSARERIGDELKPAHFYRDDHRRIFAAIQRLSLANKPFDVMAVHAELEESGEAQQCGGMTYVFELANNTPSPANARRYGEIVIERATLRALRAIGDEIATAARFWTNVKDLNTLEIEVKGRAKDGEDPANFIQKHPEAGMVRQANKFERQISKMRSERHRIEFDEKLTEKERTAQLLEMDTNITKAMGDFNAMVADAKKRTP